MVSKLSQISTGNIEWTLMLTRNVKFFLFSCLKSAPNQEEEEKGGKIKKN